jgi:hypothetical protein
VWGSAVSRKKRTKQRARSAAAALLGRLACSLAGVRVCARLARPVSRILFFGSFLLLLISFL